MAHEEFLHFIWKNRLFENKNLKTTCGKPVEILRTGEPNFHAGPDFFNARIRIDGIVWAGNVEIHVRASDWNRHGHHLDPSFNNVILHVVRDHDCDITNQLQRRIHTLLLRYPVSLESRYQMLKISDQWLPCAYFIRHVPSHYLRQWLGDLHTERMEIKTGRILNIFHQCAQNWEETFYMALASGYGLPINSLPFEMVASSVPLWLLTNHRDSQTDLEAILFGQAGFPGGSGKEGPYLATLREKHRVIMDGSPGKPVSEHLWKFLRLRPASFPTLRISQFASLVRQHFPMLDKVLSCKSVAEMEQILRTGASDYWNTHYLFGKSSPASVKYLGQQAVRTLIINALVPFLMAYGRLQHQQDCMEFAREIIISLEAESNEIIKNWSIFGFKPLNALESQALIQLHNCYCRQRRCLECQIGAMFVESAMYEINMFKRNLNK